MLWSLFLACTTSPPGHRVEGVVVEVSANDEVIVDHEAIPGFMEAMVMPFRVQDPTLLEGLEPGHRIDARLEIGESGGFLTSIQVTGKGPAPEKPDLGPAPIRDGQQLPAYTVHTSDGSTVKLGPDQGRPIVLTFLYTRCPLPDFCPATVSKLSAMQALIEPPTLLLAVTLDPEHDTDAVLEKFARDAGADPARWKFGRAEDLDALALSAGLTVVDQGATIAHSKRMLLLDAQGKRVARYDDHAFPATEAIARLMGKAP